MTKYNNNNKVRGLLTIMLCLLFAVAEARMKSTKQGSGGLAGHFSDSSHPTALDFCASGRKFGNA